MSENVVIAEGSVGRRMRSVSRIIVDGVIVGVPLTSIGSTSRETIGGVDYRVASVRAVSSPGYGAQCGVALDGTVYAGYVENDGVLVVKYPATRARELRISFSGSTATLRERNAAAFGFSTIQIFGNSGELIPFVPASDRLSGTKYITANGTFNAPDENLHSWSKVVVSIPGGPNEVPAGLEPESTLDDMTDEEVEEIAEEIADHDPTKEPEVGQPKVSPTDASVVGTDPTTGEHVKADKDGVKVVPNVTMAIDTPPNRLRYNEGEKINFTGLLCELSENGYVFTDEKHPDGYALSGELSYPQTVARFGSSEMTPEEASEMINWTANSAYILDDHTQWICRVNERTFYKKTDGKAIVVCVWGWSNSHWNGPYTMSPVREDAITIVHYRGSDETTELAPTETITYQGVTWYCNWQYHYVDGDMNYPEERIAYEAERGNEYEIAAAILREANARVSGVPRTMVPVHWKSPYDGTLHIDSFEIKLGSGDEDTDFADISIAPPLDHGGGGGIADKGLPDDYYFNPTASGDLTGANNWWGYSGKAAKEHLGG